MRTLSKIGLIVIFIAICAGSLPLAAQYTEDEWIPKIRFELMGGWMSSVFGDMFLISEANEDTHAFFYDERYTKMFQDGLLQYWNVEGLDDGFPSLKQVFPMDIRARFQSPWFFVTFGAGFKMFSSNLDQALPIEYVRAVNTNLGYADSVNYDKYNLRVNGYALPLTGYFNMTEGRGVDAGLYLGIGPFFANVLYEKTWTEGFESIVNGDRAAVAPSISHSLRMEGKGWGFLFEAGTRLDFNISRRFALFLEAGYLYHMVFSLKGEGREMNGTTVETWEGKWMIRTTTLTADWNSGGTSVEMIDSRPTAGPNVTAEEAFRLNISGGSIRLGLSFRF